MKSFEGKNPSDRGRESSSILSSFSKIMSIHNGRPSALNLPPFSIYKSLSSCIRQASSGVMLVVIMLVWSDSKSLEA